MCKESPTVTSETCRTQLPLWMRLTCLSSSDQEEEQEEQEEQQQEEQEQEQDKKKNKKNKKKKKNNNNQTKTTTTTTRFLGFTTQYPRSSYSLQHTDKIYLTLNDRLQERNTYIYGSFLRCCSSSKKYLNNKQKTKNKTQQ